MRDRRKGSAIRRLRDVRRAPADIGALERGKLLERDGRLQRSRRRLKPRSYIVKLSLWTFHAHKAFVGEKQAIGGPGVGFRVDLTVVPNRCPFRWWVTQPRP